MLACAAARSAPVLDRRRSIPVTVISTPASTHTQKLLLPILVGGGIAGILDLTSAFMTFGWKVPRGIASGLLGARAFQGGVGTWILGVFLHFTIAFGAATIYCLASRKLQFLKENFIVCGLFYGIAVFLVMNLIVLPISAFPVKSGTFTLAGLRQGILVHMIIIGLPISFGAGKFSK
jgi:hypothetical protein